MSFDWTKVEGYREDMTAEEKLSLLENMDTDPNPQPDPEPDPAPTPSKAPSREGMISKAQFDKVSKELAAAKRQLRAANINGQLIARFRIRGQFDLPCPAAAAEKR